MFLLLALLVAEPAGTVGFLTQKELVGRDGDTLIVLPPYTYVTVIQRFGNHALVSYRVGEEVRDIRVRQGDLDAARPDESRATQTADPEKLLALYRERVPFDIYIDEFREISPAPPASSDGSSDEAPAPARYRMRIKTRNLAPEPISHIRFEVQIYFDTPRRNQSDLLWQLRILTTRPREFKTVQTPFFSVETLRSSVRNVEKASELLRGKTRAEPQSEAEPEVNAEEPAPSPPKMRFAVRLFIDELFIAQKTGIVRQIDEEEDDSLWTVGPSGAGGSSRVRFLFRPRGTRRR